MEGIAETENIQDIVPVMDIENDDEPAEDNTPRVELENRESAYSTRLQTFAIKNVNHIDVMSFLNDAFTVFNVKISESLQTQHVLKVGGCFVVEIIKNEIIAKWYIYCEHATLSSGTDILEWFKKNIIDEIMKKKEDFDLHGSGWQIHSLLELEVHTNKYDVLRGSAFMPLPSFLANKGAIINVDNTDEYCFMYAVLACCFPKARNPQRHQLYRQHVHELNFTGLQFPVSLHDISKFEKNNPTISVNVYMFDEETNKIYSVRLTPGNKKEKNIHLMLLCDADGETAAGEVIRRTHYCYIKSLSRLLRAQVSGTKRALHFCDRCLLHFASDERLNAHIPVCIDRNDCAIQMPTVKDNIRFKNYEKQLAVPYIYADIEALLKSPTQLFCNSDRTRAYQQHETYSIGFYMKCNFDSSLSEYKFRRGSDCIPWFAKELMETAEKIAKKLRKEEKINISDAEEAAFQTCTRCHICRGKIEVNETKVRDHCHLTGEFRGAAHQACNLLYETSKTIPVVFHNLSNYDAHFIIREISTQFSGEVSIIPINDQNYISFTKTVDEAKVPA